VGEGGKSRATVTRDLNRNQSPHRIGGTIRGHGIRGSIDAEDSLFPSWRVTESADASQGGLGVALMVSARAMIGCEV